MKRYAAFLRGVMPYNCKMADLKRAFESAGFTEVKTVLGSGNVVFSAEASGVRALERTAEQAMAKTMGRVFFTIVRPVAELKKLVAADPFARLKAAPDAKRVVTFLRTKPKQPLVLPKGEIDGARMLAHRGAEVFTAYRITPRARLKGPTFMRLIEQAAGTGQTTRSWQTIEKILMAAGSSAR